MAEQTATGGKFRSFLRSSAQDIFWGTIIVSLKELFEKTGKKLPEDVTEYFKKLVRDNPRGELVRVIFQMDKKLIFNFLDRLTEASKQGHQDPDVKALASLLPRTADGKLDIDTAKAIFSEVAKLNPKRFRQVVEILHHNPIEEKLLHWLSHGKTFGEALIYAFGEFAGLAHNGLGAVARAAEGVNQGAAQTAQEINDWRERSEFCRVNRRGDPRRSIWTWFVSKNRGLI